MRHFKANPVLFGEERWLANHQGKEGLRAEPIPFQAPFSYLLVPTGIVAMERAWVASDPRASGQGWAVGAGTWRGLLEFLTECRLQPPLPDKLTESIHFPKPSLAGREASIRERPYGLLNHCQGKLASNSQTCLSFLSVWIIGVCPMPLDGDGA